MSKLEQIESQIEALSDEEIKRLHEWLEELKADRWDRQIEADILAGKLDKFAEEALAELDAGKTRRL